MNPTLVVIMNPDNRFQRYIQNSVALHFYLKHEFTFAYASMNDEVLDLIPEDFLCILIAEYEASKDYLKSAEKTAELARQVRAKNPKCTIILYSASPNFISASDEASFDLIARCAEDIQEVIRELIKS